VAWIVLLAVLVGVAAALLSRPVQSLAPGSPSLGALTWSQLTEILTIALVIGVGFWLFFTFTGERMPVPGRVVATVLVVLLLGVLFVVLAGLVHIAPIPAPTNSTGNPHSPGNTTGLNGSGNGTGFHFGGAGVNLPAWVGYAAVLAIAVVAGVFLVPYMLVRAEVRRRHTDGGEPAREAQKALQEALTRLESAGPADARATIVALYAHLLLLVGPRLGTVESRTPREIQRDSIESLGLRSRVARDLTETFEEARYSGHPMTQESVERARMALTEAISDLAESAGADS
jgi:Domain of unknown function (DUF4129)